MSTETIDLYRFAIPVPIRWNDLDPLGHVNNIYYFEYFQIARSQYMPAVSKKWNWEQHMFVIAHIECDYYKEITLKSLNPIIKTRTAAISNKSFVMEYIITSQTLDGTTIVHAKGKSVNVMVDTLAKKSIEIPDWLRDDLNTYESTSA